MLFKLTVAVLFFLVLVNLVLALVALMKDRGDTKRAVKALTWRIGLSLLLFVLLLIGFMNGWIQPHGLVPDI